MTSVVHKGMARGTGQPCWHSRPGSCWGSRDRSRHTRGCTSLGTRTCSRYNEERGLQPVVNAPLPPFKLSPPPIHPRLLGRGRFKPCLRPAYYLWPIL